MSRILRRLSSLLIVPYGIETVNNKKNQAWRLVLLIVPYGIETRKVATIFDHPYSFNRTLWN